MLLLLYSCTNNEQNPLLPKAIKIPVIDTLHGKINIDNYAWLTNKDSPEVMKYLKTENQYTDNVMHSAKKLQDELYGEIIGKIKETDLSTPYIFNGFWYYERTEKNKGYPIYCRKEKTLEAKEEIILDVNKMAEGYEYYSIDGWQISPNNEIIAYYQDTIGEMEAYDVYFKSLKTGKLYKDKLANVQGESVVWANDSKILYYVLQDSSNRGYKVFKHELNSGKKDQLIFHEKDSRFNVWMEKSKSGKYIFIASFSSTSSEYWFLNADRPNDDFQLINSREENHLYYKISHNGSKFYIVTNKNAPNFKIVETGISEPQSAHWTDFIPHRVNVHISKFELFKDYLTFFERENGLDKIRIIDLTKETDYYIDFDEPIYNVYSTFLNPEFNTNKLRYVYTSMITPKTIYEYNMETREKSALKQIEIPNYNKNGYVTERLWAKAQDGTAIPISIVYKKGITQNGKNPLLITGYGAYGGTRNNTINFSVERLNLLERGFIYADAHVRGSSYLGEHWYEQGKLLNKKNTFTDFIACTEYLIGEGYTSKGNVVAYGKSAGGLLMGVIANMRPDLYKAVILDYPFIDVVNTMLDSTLTYTTQEYEEWGNPNNKKHFDYMFSYSPYDNIKKQNYPSMLFITGLNDAQVGYWNAAKMVAKLREHKTDNNQLLLKTSILSGHRGKPSRYAQYEESVFIQAFILKTFNIEQ